MLVLLLALLLLLLLEVLLPLLSVVADGNPNKDGRFKGRNADDVGT